MSECFKIGDRVVVCVGNGADYPRDHVESATVRSVGYNHALGRIVHYSVEMDSDESVCRVSAEYVWANPFKEPDAAKPVVGAEESGHQAHRLRCLELAATLDLGDVDLTIWAAQEYAEFVIEGVGREPISQDRLPTV